LQLSHLKSDRRAENDGEWVECPELGIDDETKKPVRLKVRSFNYAPYRIAVGQTNQRLAREYPGNKLVPPDVRDVASGRNAAAHLLLDWEGIDPKYTPEIAEEALTDVAHRDLRDAVLAAAMVVGTRRVEQAKALAGNSPPGSDGK